jgi:inhibitor of cysteine peptidase
VADVVVTSRDDGGVVSVSMGDRIVLDLPENPTTGYVWAFEVLDESLLDLDGSDWQAAGRGTGTGGDRVWRLGPRRPGTTRLELKRWRPWAGEPSVIERFALTVEISAG